MKISTIGIDLAKDIFQIHAVDQQGKVVQRKKLRRSEMAIYFSNLEPCLIGMEACASAHHWARKLAGMGHTVKLMAPQFVKPYVKANKNDAADAEAICEQVTRPTMRFVRDVEQHSLGSQSAAVVGDAENELTCGMRDLIKGCYERVKNLTAEIDQQEFTIRQWDNRTL